MLTQIINATTAAASTDKMIKAGVDTQATMYTCPAGRKFIGQVVVGPGSSSTIKMAKTGTLASIAGGSGHGMAWDIYLSAGDSVIGQYAGISGIESDA